MDMALDISSAGRAARSQANIKLRQPLAEVVVVVPSEKANRIENILDILKEELNVKNVRIETDQSVLQRLEPMPIASKLGRKHGRNYPLISDAVKSLGGESIAKLAKGEPIIVQLNGNDIVILNDEVDLRTVPKEAYSVVQEHDTIVGDYTLLTEDLESEGLARDVVRRIQALRKEANFDIDDQIVVYYLGSQEIEDVFKEESDYIMAETLSDELVNGRPPSNAKVQDYDIDGLEVKLGVLRR